MENLINSTLNVLYKLKKGKPITTENLKKITQVPDKKNWENKQNTIVFDRDSSPQAWEYYNVFFRTKGQKTLNNKRLTVEKDGITFAGDCSFNFNDDKKTKFEEIIKSDPKFEEIIKSDPNKKDTLYGKPEVCHKMHHNLLNFDLIPVTGGMNNLKGHLKHNKENKILVHDLGKLPKDLHDRLDTFLAFIDQSLKERNKLKGSKIELKEVGKFFANSVFTTSLRGENFENLYDFIEKYTKINAYCKEMYGIDDETIIKKLVKSGKNKISDAKTLEAYMDLAIDYWILKGKMFIKIIKKGKSYE